MKNTITSKQACTLAHQIRRETGCSLADAFKAAYAGNTTVNTKTTWTRDDLDQIFSDKAAELLRKGYLINTNDMGGHQGEIAKIFFRKNDKIYILVMESKSDFRVKYGDKIVIRFGKASDDDFGTIWVSHMSTEWSFEVVKIADNWFTTEELADECNAKYRSRLEAHWVNSSTKVDSKYHKALLKMVRKQKGYKGTKLEDIARAYREYPCDCSGNLRRRYYNVILNKQDKYGHTIVVDIRF